MGWVILHPDGSVETDYFSSTKWSSKGVEVSRATWRKRYRPKCRMVRATLTFSSQPVRPKPSLPWFDTCQTLDCQAWPAWRVVDAAGVVRGSYNCDEHAAGRRLRAGERYERRQPLRPRTGEETER